MLKAPEENPVKNKSSVLYYIKPRERSNYKLSWLLKITVSSLIVKAMVDVHTQKNQLNWDKQN